MKKRLEGIDIDTLLMTGSLEQYVTDESHTAFPLTAYTERPDRFCRQGERLFFPREK